MLVPVACRFVPYDQWFVTHLDDDSKVKQIKHWILSKCNLVQSLSPQTHRPVSPITFAPSIRSQSSLDSLDDGYHEDDEYSDRDLLPRYPTSRLGIYPHLDPKPGSSSQTVQPGSCSLVDQYTLLSFSTGSILEDEFTLSLYNFRPYELLEMHPLGIVAPLQRNVLSEYIQPYFQARVRVLRAVWNHRSGRFEPPGIDTQREHGGHKAKDKLVHRLDTFSPKSTSSQSAKRRKTKVDWKSRWVVINNGTLYLCKEHVTSPPLHQFELSSMRAIRGTDALERAFSIAAQPWVVCIKFRPRPASLVSVVSPPPSFPSSPTSEDLKSNVQDPLPHMDCASDSRQMTEQEDLGERSTQCAFDPNNAYDGEGDWVVLDMLDDHAFSSILRILHREASGPLSSSFVPSSSFITVSQQHFSPPVPTSFASYDTIPYPEWRVNTIENARKAGMGDVGKPMAWVLWTEKGLGESLLGNIRHHRQAFSREMQYKTSIIPSNIYQGSDDESDDDSEMEWEGWIRDLARQSRVKQQLEKTSGSSTSRQAHIPSSISSPLPSPPLSEASPSGSPRVRSPSLPVSHLATGSFGPYPHTRYPNIGNIIQANGACGYRSTELSYPSEKVRSTTVSTVSVGTAPSPRRRSSTLSSELATTTKRDHDKGKQDREPFPIIPMNSARVNTRTVSVSAGSQSSPSAFVRHVHSSSNLRMSSSPHGSDARETPVHPGPSSPSKGQSAFMRGVTLRAGKLVRGLESAIDFVDEKTV